MRKREKILKAFYVIILMARYFWLIFILVIIAAFLELTGIRSLEITIALFSINFMVLSVELWGRSIKRTGIMVRLENLEMVLNDITSFLVSPDLSQKKQQVIEWLNKF